MNARFLASLGAAALVAAVALRPTAVASQPPAPEDTANRPAASTRWTPPLTADGRPDLQGVWVSNSATPLERPKELEGKPLLTDAEVAELQKRADRLFRMANSDFASGDNVFLAALAGVEVYDSPTATGSSDEMIEREFENRTSLVVDPPDGKIPPLTPAGQAGGQGPRFAEGPEDLRNDHRCLTFGVPRLGGNYGAGPYSYYQIVQTRDHVVLFMEVAHEARIIPLDGRPHLPETLRQWTGDSRGRWEGTTLVVETSNFSPKSNYRGASDNLHLIERFTRAAPDTLNYEITVDDPTTWTRPWTALIRLRHTTQRLYEFACHEGNYDVVRGMLGAARVDAEEAAKKDGR